MAKQDRRADKALHNSKMALLRSIRQSVERPEANKTIGDLLSSATPREKALVRSHLQRMIDYWNGVGAPIEASCAERALRAFDSGEYDYGHITRYLKPEVVERIFG